MLDSFKHIKLWQCTAIFILSFTLNVQCVFLVTGRHTPVGDATQWWRGQRTVAVCPMSTQWWSHADWSESTPGLHHLLNITPNSVIDWFYVRTVRRRHTQKWPTKFSVALHPGIWHQCTTQPRCRCIWPTFSPLLWHQPSCCTTLQTFYGRQPSFSGCRRHDLERTAGQSRLNNDITLQSFRRHLKTFLFQRSLC